MGQKGGLTVRPVSLLIKPVSGACNMACSYCFYRGDSGHNRGVMTEDTAKALIRSVFEYATADVCFAFQGGEPTLAGVEFFERFVAMAESDNKRGLPVFWSVQTNGIDPDQKLCDFFAIKGFLVGISLDGTRDIHDSYRKTPCGQGSFDSVLKGIEAYRAAGADVNILTVVSDELARNADASWDELAKLGLPCLQFILCLENESGRKHYCAPTVEEYGDFLIASFDKWKHHIEIGDYISVRQFDNMVSAALGYPCELCSFAGKCTNQLVCESDGSVYPCDFYVDEKYLEGNISENSVAELLNSKGALKFISERPCTPKECYSCSWGALCRGGCRREFNRSGKTRYCQSYRRFFKEREKEICNVISLVKAGKIKTSRV